MLTVLESEVEKVPVGLRNWRRRRDVYIEV
jgi:hypothetical protein